MLQRLEAKAKKKKRSRRARPVIAMANQWAHTPLFPAAWQPPSIMDGETGVTASADPIVWRARETMRVGDGGAE